MLVKLLFAVLTGEVVKEEEENCYQKPSVCKQCHHMISFGKKEASTADHLKRGDHYRHCRQYWYESIYFVLLLQESIGDYALFLL